MQKSRILVLLLALAIFFTAGCAHEEDQDSQADFPLADNIFTNPPETEKLPTNPDGTDGSSISIAAEVQKDEIGPYLVYEGGEMHLPLRIQIGDLPDKNFGIHLYVDGQPQPYHTAENDTAQYMHSFPSMNGKEFLLDLIFTPVTGQSGDVLEIGFAIVAYPEYFIDDAWEGITMMDWSGMGMTVRMKYLEDPPSAHLPEVQDRVVSLSQAHIDLTASETDLFSSGEYQKEVAYEICVNGQKSYGNLFSVTGGDKLDVEFELKGSSAADFGLVMYLDHQPVSICAEDLIFVHTQNGKKMTVKAEIDLSGFDGEGVFYAVIVPRNCRINQLGGSCLLTILGPYYLSSAATLDTPQSEVSSIVRLDCCMDMTYFQRSDGYAKEKNIDFLTGDCDLLYRRMCA